VLKYLLFIVFYLVEIYSFFAEITLVANVNLFVVSALTAAYSYAIFNTKYFWHTNRENNAGVNAVDVIVPTENVFRHHLQNNNAQVAFDQANFGGGLAEAGQDLAEAEFNQVRPGREEGQNA
jgi:hypothetical protein